MGLDALLCLTLNLAICQSSRSWTYTPFLAQGSKLSLFSIYEQWFPRFQDFPKFSKLQYLVMKLGHWPKCQKLHITLFLPKGVEIELIFAKQSVVSELCLSLWNGRGCQTVGGYFQSSL